MVMKNLGGAARAAGGIGGGGGRNVSKINQNGAAAPSNTSWSGKQIREFNDFVTSMNKAAQKQINAGLKKLK
jgi:hypothetical protein